MAKRRSGSPLLGSEERPSKLLRNATAGPRDFASMVTVIVGSVDARETFVLPEHLLRESSVFFDKSLNSKWEKLERTVNIPAVSPKRFAVYAKFLSTGLLSVKTHDDKQPLYKKKDGKESSNSEDLDDCVHLLELAGFLQASSFQDAILDACMEAIAELRLARKGQRFAFSVKTINGIYAHSAMDSSIRKFFVHVCLHAWRVDSSYDRGEFDRYTPEFLDDFIKSALPYIISKEAAHDMFDPIGLENACKYHEHTKRGEPCYRIKHQYLAKKNVATVRKTD